MTVNCLLDGKDVLAVFYLQVLAIDISDLGESD